MFESNSHDLSSGSPLNNAMCDQDYSPLNAFDLVPTGDLKLSSPAQ